MSSSKTITITYGGQKKKIPRCNKYSTLIKYIQKVFSLSDSQLSKISLGYLDEDDEMCPLEENTFNNENSTINNITLTIEPIPTFDKEENVDPSKIKEEIINQFSEKNKQISKKIEEFEKNFNESSRNYLEKEIKKIDKDFEEKKNQLKSDYLEIMEGIKENSKNEIKDFLLKLGEEITNNFKNEDLPNIDKDIINNLKEKVNTIQNHCNEEIKKINFSQIKDEQEKLRGLINETKNNFVQLTRTKTFTEIREELSKSKNEQIKEKENQMDDLCCEFVPLNKNDDHPSLKKDVFLTLLKCDGLDIEFTLKNVGKYNLPQQCTLEVFISGKRDEKADLELDLCNITPGETKKLKKKIRISDEIIKVPGYYPIGIRVFCTQLRRLISKNTFNIELNVQEESVERLTNNNDSFYLLDSNP